jgi:hypothetical protein
MLDPYVISKQKRQPATKHARVCAFCGEPFAARHSDAKYCKNACRIAAQKPAKHATTCAECGKAIVSKYPRKYCSNDCRNAWWNHNRPYQSSLFATADRPDSAPVCSVPGCGRHLYGYEVGWGKCLPHKHGGIIHARESVPVHLTDEATRTRTRNNHRKHQPAARAGAGD